VTDCPRRITVVMRTPVTLMALGLASLVIAGCGSGSNLGTGPKRGPLSFKAGTTTTIANVKTGALIRCLGIETAPVPPRGQQVAYSPDHLGSSGEIHLLHMENGSLTVSCVR
jgi:hypothetical protein